MDIIKTCFMSTRNVFPSLTVTFRDHPSVAAGSAKNVLLLVPPLSRVSYSNETIKKRKNEKRKQMTLLLLCKTV